MVEELPEVLEIGEITLKVDETFCYTAWGTRYRFKGGNWQISDIVFRRKSDTEDWVKAHIARHKDMEAEVVPVKRCMLQNKKGYIKAWTEELA